eukprot:COSAG02_NODE_1829_length_10738_cov_4.595827_7_plen_224_part_00
MLRGIIQLCTPCTRFWLLRSLLAAEPRRFWSSPPPPAVASFILHGIKDETASALGAPSGAESDTSTPNPFGTTRVLEVLALCKAACATGGLGELYHQPAPVSASAEDLRGQAADLTSSRLVEQADVLLSCLNLLRFVLIRDHSANADDVGGRTGVRDSNYQRALREEVALPLQLRLEALQAALGRLSAEHGHEHAAWAQTRVGMVAMVNDAILEMLPRASECE